MAKNSKAALIEAAKVEWEEFLDDNPLGLSRAAAAKDVLNMMREDPQLWERLTQVRVQVGLPELDPVELAFAGELKARALQSEQEVAAQIEKNNAGKKPPRGRRSESIY
jgi:hypothetical protein